MKKVHSFGFTGGCRSDYLLRFVTLRDGGGNCWKGLLVTDWTSENSQIAQITRDVDK